MQWSEAVVMTAARSLAAATVAWIYDAESVEVAPYDAGFHFIYTLRKTLSHDEMTIRVFVSHSELAHSHFAELIHLRVAFKKEMMQNPNLR